MGQNAPAPTLGQNAPPPPPHTPESKILRQIAPIISSTLTFLPDNQVCFYTKNTQKAECLLKLPYNTGQKNQKSALHYSLYLSFFLLNPWKTSPYRRILKKKMHKTSIFH